MHILIGLFMGVALLYFWLIGWWFARVLVFLFFACVGFSGGAALARISPDAPLAAIIILGLIGAALAWPIASLPVYWRRHQSRMLDRHVTNVLTVLGAGIPRVPEERY